MKAAPLLLLCGLIAVLSDAHAQERSVLRDAGQVPVQLAGAGDPDETRVYIVQLRSPGAAERHAKLARTKFDKNSATVSAWVAEIDGEQQRILAKAGAGTQKIYGYRFGFNGFAARMSVAQAQKLQHDPGVLNVWEDEIRPLATRYSPNFLDLFDAQEGLRGALDLDGEDIVIGVIDSGITPEHPSLQDTREADMPRLCRGSWAETTLLGMWLCKDWRRQPDVLAFEEPEDWNGACIAGERFETTDCNNKLIGARWFIDGALASGPIDDDEIRSPRDADGHGTHTATTAAGNRASASIFGTLIGDIQGMAPRARIAAYKACWVRPGDTRASCNTSDLAQAIDAAVADGVDIINYSVGSSLLRVTAPDDVALMAAAKAGVVAVVAAGNEGPNLGTIGSPAGGPWVITAAASTRDGQSHVEAFEVLTPPSVADRYAVREAVFTPPLEDVDPIEGRLVLADDDDTELDSGATGSEADGCQPLVNDDEIDGNIALLQRTGCRFDTMVANAADAGAVAAIVYNIAGDPIVMHGESGLSDIPALMMGQADASLLLAEFDAGNDVTVLLEKGLLLASSDSGDDMAPFSARGPAPVADILKPDVTAPGVNILAGFSPDSAYSADGENFAYLSGTSMSTPHVAGIAALLRQAHPEWSPAILKSALMTTARQDIASSGGIANATPFDFGSGHIVPNSAVDPGLAYDITNEEYDAFAADMENEARNLNLPSISVSGLAFSQTVTRRVTNVSDESGSYLLETSPPPGMRVDIVPNSLSLGPGESASFDITMSYESGPLDLWRFGSFTWRSPDHAVYSPIAVKPTSVVAPEEQESAGGTGSLNFDVEFGYSGGYAPGVHGLNLPLVIDGFVDNDPTKTYSFRDTNGVTRHIISIPAGQLYARFALFDALTDGDDDLDLYVYYCGLDGSSCTRIGESGEQNSDERVDVLQPAEGLYAVHVHGFATDEIQGGPGANYQLVAWGIGIVDDKGNMSASGPSTVSAGTTGTVNVDWTGLISNTIYMGAISHNTPQGLSALTLITIRN